MSFKLRFTERIKGKKIIIPGEQVGYNSLTKEKQFKALDTDKLEYCWLHNITLTSDWRNPNPADKKKLDRIRLVEGHSTDKNGKEEQFRFCPKCYQIVKDTNE